MPNEKALFLIGDGNTGKSQIRKFADLLVGRNNSTGQDLDDLEKRFGTSLMYGKRVCGSSDLKFSAIPELNVFKKTTGGDPVDAEFKGESAFSFIYKGVSGFAETEFPSLEEMTVPGYMTVSSVFSATTSFPKKNEIHCFSKSCTQKDRA
ncbi:DUF5906 domain-containing protein [Allobaculum mucilyticum]|uniref:DUF5906 domain-containing protein n=1 Tax=Allobaculum mucilyticum TaxID=2834459 RepID=UPI003BF8569A